MRTTMRTKHQNNLMNSIERQYFNFSCSDCALIGKEYWSKDIEHKRFNENSRIIC